MAVTQTADTALAGRQGILAAYAPERARFAQATRELHGADQARTLLSERLVAGESLDPALLDQALSRQLMAREAAGLRGTALSGMYAALSRLKGRALPLAKVAAAAPDKDKLTAGDAAKAVGGGVLAKRTAESGLDRLFGLTNQQHVTHAKNVESIRRGGNVLRPEFGGTGAGAHMGSNSFMENSKGFVHMTGIHPEATMPFLPDEQRKFYRVMQPMVKRMQGQMYRTVHNMPPISPYASKLDRLERQLRGFRDPKTQLKAFLGLNTKTYHASHPASWWAKNFRPDTDDMFAQKTTKPVKVFTSRLGATLAGIREHGLTGIRENPGRALRGAGLLGLGGYASYKMLRDPVRKLLALRQPPESQRS